MSTPSTHTPHMPRLDHSVPFLWPFAAAMELGEAGARLFQDNLRYIGEAARIDHPEPPKWASPNRVRLDLDTMALREFGGGPEAAGPVLVDAPYAGHSATIADYRDGQSLVQTLLAAGLGRVHVTDWKPATEAMKDFDIDKYLAEINVVVDDLGAPVNLVGLCQGGWMCAMFAARFPRKVRSLVLAGSPIDTSAGDGPLRQLVQELPQSFYEEMVGAGGGRMRGAYMLAGWKNMHPDQQYLAKYLDLYAHIEDRNYLKRTEAFERWYEHPVDLPGRYYLQAIGELFRANALARGQFVALGQRIALSAIRVPVYLLAGEHDDITPAPQVFAAEKLLGTPAAAIRRQLVPGGHIGLFMGEKTLAGAWPEIGRWIRAAA